MICFFMVLPKTVRGRRFSGPEFVFNRGFWVVIWLFAVCSVPFYQRCFLKTIWLSKRWFREGRRLCQGLIREGIWFFQAAASHTISLMKSGGFEGQV